MKFKPTEEQIQLADCAFMAMAQRSEVEKIVVPYQRSILEKNRWKVADIFHERVGQIDVVLKPEDVCFLSEPDMLVYVLECDRARIKAGLSIKRDGNCPLLEAKELERQATHALLNSFKPVTGLEASDYLIHGTESLDKAIDLTMRLMTPFSDPHKRFGLPKPKGI